MSTVRGAGRPPADVPSPAPGLASVVGFLVVLEFASGMLQGWLTPLLPGILQRYEATAAELNWISVVYLLSSTVFVPLLAKLGDLHGHRRLLVVAATLVAVGSVLVAVAPTFGVLLVGRALQGPLNAFLPLEFAILRERAGDRAGRAISLLVGALAVGGSLGFLFSGVARQYLSLPATLWIPAVLMIVTVPVAAVLVPETTVRAAGRIDWAGAALLGLGLGLVLLAVGNGSTWGWTDARTVGGIVVGLAALAAWVAVERRAAHPLIELSVLARPELALPMLAGFCLGAELFGAQVASTLFLGLPTSTGYGLGVGPGGLGLVLLVFGIAAFVGTWLAPRLTERLGTRPALAIGALLIATGYLLTALLHGAVGAFVVWQVLVGVGNGLVLATLSANVATRAPADAVGISSGLFNTARTVGGALSGAVFAAVMAALLVRLPGVPKPVTSQAGYVTVWLVCAGLALLVGALATRLGREPRTADPR